MFHHGRANEISATPGLVTESLWRLPQPSRSGRAVSGESRVSSERWRLSAEEPLRGVVEGFLDGGDDAALDGDGWAGNARASGRAVAAAAKLRGQGQRLGARLSRRGAQMNLTGRLLGKAEFGDGINLALSATRGSGAFIHLPLIGYQPHVVSPV